MGKIEELITLIKTTSLNEQYKQQLVDDFINASGDYYEYFRKIIKKIGVMEFLKVYDFKKIDEYFKKNKNEYDKYKLFVCLLEQNEYINDTIDCILQDDFLFDQIFMEMDNIYSIFSNIDYDKIKKIIKKIEKSNFKYSNNFIMSIEKEKQYQLLQEDFSLDVLNWIYPKLSLEVKKYFFANDKRAYRLLTTGKINLDILFENNVKFQDDILYSDFLMNYLKSVSLVEFRRRVDFLLMSNPNLFLLEKINKYLDSLITSYNESADLFKIYEDLTLDNLVEKVNETEDKYLLSFVLLHETFNMNEEEFQEFLKQKTGIKLMELIIVRLFQDNYYNVFLNIKELLDYNNSLKNPLIDSKYIKFYKDILNFLNLNNKEKIEIFHKVKDKNINTLFYEHLRIYKDHSYRSMISKLYQPQKEDLSKELSKEVSVYVLNGDAFTMLVRGLNMFYPYCNISRNCYSVIDNTNLSVAGDYTHYYGYYQVNPDTILHVYENDAFSSDSDTNKINRIRKTEELTKHDGYSEVQIINEKQNNQYKTLYPDFIVVFDSLNKSDIDEAKRLNIPIVMIQRQYYKTEQLEPSHMLYTNVSDGFRYVKTIDDEENIKRIKH